MSKLAITPTNISSALGLATIEHGLSLCNRIIEYRAATRQIELQREQMHREADIEHARLDNQLKEFMTKIKALSDGQKITLQANNKNVQTNAELIISGEKLIAQTMQYIANEQNIEVKKMWFEQLKDLQDRQKELIAQHGKLIGVPMQSFIELNDTYSYRLSGRTYTDSINHLKDVNR